MTLPPRRLLRPIIVAAPPEVNPLPLFPPPATPVRKRHADGYNEHADVRFRGGLRGKGGLMPSVEDTARLLAEEHSGEDDGIRAIYWAPSEAEVNLLEVSTSVADRGEVPPFRFTSDSPPFPTCPS